MVGDGSVFAGVNFPTQFICLKEDVLKIEDVGSTGDVRVKGEVSTDSQAIEGSPDGLI